MIFNLITKAKELFYKNGQTVEGALDSLNESLGKIEYLALNQTLGTTSNRQPWLELEAQFSKFEVGKEYIGRVTAEYHYSFQGKKTSNDYASFFVQCYVKKAIYHVYVLAGTWYHEELVLNSDLAGKYLLQPFTMSPTDQYNDCNELPIGSMGYTYGTTANAPSVSGAWYIFTYGMSNEYKVQIANHYNEGAAFRTCLGDTWYDWVKMGKQSDIDTLSTNVSAINTALPYTIEIDDNAKTINFIDR